MVALIARFMVVFLAVLASLAASDANMLDRLGMGGGGYVLGAALVVAAISFHHKPFYLIGIVVLVVAANMPSGMATHIGMDPDLALAGLFSMLITPAIMELLDD